MPISGSDLINLVTKRLADTGGKFFTDSEVLEHANQCLDEVAMDVPRSYVSKCIERTSTTLTWATGSELPNDVLKMFDVYVVKSQIANTPPWIKVEFIGDGHNKHPEYCHIDPNHTRGVWWIENGAGYARPCHITAAEHIIYNYLKHPTDFDTSTPANSTNLGDGCLEPLVLKTCEKLKHKEHDFEGAAFFQQVYDKIIAKINGGAVV